MTRPHSGNHTPPPHILVVRDHEGRRQYIRGQERTYTTLDGPWTDKLEEARIFKQRARAVAAAAKHGGWVEG